MARKRSFARGSNPSSVILGSEPSFDGFVGDDLVWEINKSMNWYRNNFNHSHYKNALKEYLKNNKMSMDAISAPKKMFEWQYAGIYSHIANKGIILPSTIQECLDKNINALASNSSKNNEDAPSVNVQENIKNKISELIADFEINVDVLLESFSKKNKPELINVSDWIRDNNIKSIHANKMADFFFERQQELELALSGKDDQLKEGYSWIGKSNLRKYLDFIANTVNLLREQAAVARSQRKPRAKKKKTPDQLTAKVQYMKQFDELKLTSVSPKEIIGSSRVILYNTKNRVLSFYESSQLSDGLSVKGSKIINFDTKNSSCKKVRNVDILMSGGRFVQGLRASANAYSEIKTKQSPVNGRLNENTIIIQVLNR